MDVQQIIALSAVLGVFAVTWIAASEPAPGDKPSLNHKCAKICAWIIGSPAFITICMLLCAIVIITLPFKGVMWAYNHAPRPIALIMEKLGMLAISPFLAMLYLGCLFFTPIGFIIVLILVLCT